MRAPGCVHRAMRHADLIEKGHRSDSACGRSRFSPCHGRFGVGCENLTRSIGQMLGTAGQVVDPALASW
jgi:hypothetical protein